MSRSQPRVESMAPSVSAATTNRVGPVTGQPDQITVSDDEPCPVNKTILQGFEWYCPNDNKHWRRLAKAVPNLAAVGVTSMWIPPAAKAGWQESNGYGIYDLYDLGEFDQKGATCTKWGFKDELVDLVETSNAHGISILFDAVLNHKAAADYTEMVSAIKMNPKNRTEFTSKPEVIEAWTGFDFEGRAGKYSSMRWNKDHFTGVDYDNKSKSQGVWRFENKTWAAEVDDELGNYDYLMFADIDHKNPEVREDLFHWVEWLSSQLKLGGLRLDAIKHYSGEFLRDFLRHIDQAINQDWFIVGEYWRDDSKVLARYIDYMHNRISLFDVKLAHNFALLSWKAEPDWRTVFNGALVTLKPQNTVTFVGNHDMQYGGALETPISPYIVPLAYAFILLRVDTGLPCVFYGNLYGSWEHRDDRSNLDPPACGGLILPKIMLTRLLYAYGTQINYFDEPGCIGFTRLGHRSQSGGAGLAVVLNSCWEATSKRMNVGTQHAGERWTDMLRWCWGEVVIDVNGWGAFGVGPRSVSLWASKTAQGRERLDGLVFDHDIYNLKDMESTKLKVDGEPEALLPPKELYPAWLRRLSRSSGDSEACPGNERSNFPL